MKIRSGKDADLEAFFIEIKILNTLKQSQELPEKTEWDRAMENKQYFQEKGGIQHSSKAKRSQFIRSQMGLYVKESYLSKVMSFKMKLVTQGLHQTKGIDCLETFMPMVSCLK